MNTIAPIKTLTLNPKQLSRIQKAKATGKHLGQMSKQEQYQFFQNIRHLK
jgi:hypothetical protein